MHEFNHSGNLIISPDNRNRFQNLYASQVYQTFFGMYARLPINHEKPNTETSVFLEKIEVQIQNFKGLLDLGFPRTDDPARKYSKKIIYPTSEDGNEITDGVKTIEITIFIKGKVNNDVSHSLEINWSDMPALNDGDTLLIKRELLSLYGDTKEEVQQFVRSPRPEKNEKGFKPFAGGLFDSEFYYRNGSLLIKKQNGDGMLNNNHTYPEVGGLSQDTKSCKTSRNKLFITNT